MAETMGDQLFHLLSPEIQRASRLANLPYFHRASFPEILCRYPAQSSAHAGLFQKENPPVAHLVATAPKDPEDDAPDQPTPSEVAPPAILAQPRSTEQKTKDQDKDADRSPADSRR